MLAQKAGVSVYRLVQYERDLRMPDERTLIALADALGVQPHFLLRESMVNDVRVLHICRITQDE